MEEAEQGHRRPGGLRRRLGGLAGVLGDAVLEGVDPDAVLDQVDVNHLLDRVDPNRVLDRVDVNRLLDRVDPDRLLDRVDPDRLLDRVDVDRLMDRVDVERIVERAQVPSLVASSTGRMAGSLLDVVRRQAVGLDVVIMRALLRLFRRDPETVPAGPPNLVGDTQGVMAAPTPQRPTYDVTGRYAGPVTRLAGNAGDIAAGVASFTLVTAGLTYVLAVVLGFEIDTQNQAGPVWIAGLALWLFLYGWISIAVVGRTPAMAVLGLRVVTREGDPLSPRRAAARVLVQPISTVVFGLGYLGLVLDRERRTWHDLAAGSTVVYDWGGRAASLPTPLGRFLARHEPDVGAVPDAEAGDGPTDTSEGPGAVRDD